MEKEERNFEAGFSALAAIERAMSTWWLILAVMLLGAFVGLGISAILPPMYEAGIRFTVTVDYTQTGELTEYDVDQIQWGVAGVIYSPLVAESVSQKAKESGISVSPEALMENTFIERRQAKWDILIRYPDADQAAILANLWADIAYRDLVNAHQHAIQARILEGYLDTLGKCMVDAENSTERSPSELSIESTPSSNLDEPVVIIQCQLPDLFLLDAEIEKVQGELELERQVGRGVFPAILFDLTEKAVVPEKPVLYGRNTLVFFSAGIGFLLGLWLVTSTKTPEFILGLRNR